MALRKTGSVWDISGRQPLGSGVSPQANNSAHRSDKLPDRKHVGPPEACALSGQLWMLQQTNPIRYTFNI